MLHRRRHLHPTIALGAKEGFALVCNIVPGPFKQVDDDVSVSLTRGVSVAPGDVVQDARLDPHDHHHHHYDP